MDNHGIKIVLEPPRFARRGIAMHTPVSCYIRVPVRSARDERGSNFDLGTIIRWTGTIRNITTHEVLQLDVDETRFLLIDEIIECMETPDELFLFIFNRYVVPRTPPRAIIPWTLFSGIARPISRQRHQWNRSVRRAVACLRSSLRTMHLWTR